MQWILHGMGSLPHVRECKTGDTSKGSGVLLIKFSYPFAFNGTYTVMCATYVHVVDLWLSQLYDTWVVLGRRAEAIHMWRAIVVVSTKQESSENSTPVLVCIITFKTFCTL